MSSLQRVVEVDFHFEKGSGATRIILEQPRIRILASSLNDTGIIGTVGAAPFTAPVGFTTVIRKVQNVCDVYA